MKFSIRAGAFKNVSYENFSGKISVALFSANGKLKTLLHDGKGLSLQAMQVMMPRLYSDFTCSVPAETVVANDDINPYGHYSQRAHDEWLPVTGEPQSQ